MAILTIVNLLVVMFSVHVTTGAQGGKGRLPPSPPTPVTVPKTPVGRPTRPIYSRPIPRPTASPTPRSTPVNPTRPAQIDMVRIPAGTFVMGSAESELGRSAAEGPQHTVRVASFYIGKYEVTQAQWRAVMGTNPSTFPGDDLPVENVAWVEAVDFCRRLSRATGRNYRLPTEAEWEYAARGGTSTPFAFGSSISSLIANFNGGYPYGRSLKTVFRERTTAVGTFEANAFGLHDMHGNVSEWCQDDFHSTYDGAPSRGLPAWETGGWRPRIIRGGSWRERAEEVRSASRVGKWPGTRSNSIGFRVASDSPN